jgi:hypothetical protein
LTEQTPDTKREMLRHTVATLAYRGGKAVRDAPEGFGAFHACEGMRTPVEILAHVGDLLEWALWLARGEGRWHDSAPLAWDKEVARFFAELEAFDALLASAEPLGCAAEQLFQGPVADALTHVGQINLLRRMAGAAVRGENYSKAEIVSGRVGARQAAPRVEFD